MSAEMSPTSVTVSKSTRASSGSTLLTSISLTWGVSSGLSVPLRGDAGVFGLAVVPSRLLLRAGVDGNSGAGLLVRRVRDSEESGALYFFEEARRDGVVERGRRESLRVGSESVARESLRLGVKGTGRASLLAEGVDKDMMLGAWASCGRFCVVSLEVSPGKAKDVEQNRTSCRLRREIKRNPDQARSLASTVETVAYRVLSRGRVSLGAHIFQFIFTRKILRFSFLPSIAIVLTCWNSPPSARLVQRLSPLSRYIIPMSSVMADKTPWYVQLFLSM